MSHPYSADHPNLRDPGLADNVPADVADVQQQEPDPALLVKGEVAVAGSIRTQELPALIGVARSYLVTDTTVTPLSGADKRRKRATVLAMATSVGAATAIFVGLSEDVRTGNAAIWPTNTPLVVTHSEPIYVRCATAGATAQVSVITENWAD